MATRRREVIWSWRARDGLDEAVAYIAKDSPERAIDFLERALNTAESLEQFTERGRIVPELADPAVRELIVFRYRLVYEVSDLSATILGFLHGARDFNRWWRGE